MRWNLSVAGLAASWGFIAVIVVHVHLSAEALVFYRVGIAAVTLGAGLAAARRLDLLRLPVHGRRVVVIGAVLAGHWYLFFETIKLSSVAIALVTVYTAPIFLSLLAPLFLPERRSAVALAALPPGAAGIVLIALGGNHGAHARPLALATGLGAGISYAGLVIGTKALTRSLPVLSITFWSYSIAALALVPALVGTRVAPHGGEVGFLLLLGAVFTAFSGVIYVWLLGRVTAQAIGILAYIEPVTAALLAWALLGQGLGWQVVAGGLLVVGAGLLVVIREPADAAAVEAPAVGLTGD